MSTEIYEGAPDAAAVSTVTFTPTDGGTRLSILIEHTSQENRDLHVRSGMEDGLRDAWTAGGGRRRVLSGGSERAGGAPRHRSG